MEKGNEEKEPNSNSDNAKTLFVVCEMRKGNVSKDRPEKINRIDLLRPEL